MNNVRNHVQLIGNIGKEVELKTIGSGVYVTRVPLATNEYYTNSKGEKVQNTQWHNLVLWGKTAELAAKQLEKGSQVLITGSLVSRSYDDAEGNKRYITEVKVGTFVNMSRAARAEEAPVPF